MAGTSYTRQSTFSDGDVVEASLFNNEYNQLLNAFSYASSGTTGHQHDGGAGEGGNIEIIGDQDFLNKIVVDSTNNRWGVFVEVSSSAVEQIRIQDGAIVPVTDNDIDLGTSSLEFKDAFFDGTVTTDTLTVDVNATVGGTLGVTGALTGSSTLQGTTITATTAFVPDASDGAALGTSALEFSDLFLADSAVINLGADQDTTLTHVADTGILLNSTRQFQFGDSGTYIHQSADGVLDLVSDTEIEINATTIDMNGNVDISGTLTVAGAVDFGDAALSNVGAVQLDSIAGDADSNTSITFSGSDVITMATGGTTALTIDASQNVTIAGDLTVTGDDITMSTNTSGNLLVADGTNFNSVAVGSLSEISTVASDDVFLAVDTSGGGLKKITRSTLVSGLATSSGLSNVVEDTSPQLGGDLDMNGQDIVTTSNADLELAPNGTGHVTVKGNTNSGAIQFNCENNSHGQILKAQPHSAAVTNELLLPAGANSTLVSLVSTDTLTNKTINASNNTLSNIPMSATSFSAGTGVSLSTNTLNVDAAQTGITSLLATDIKIGEDDQTKIDFETADEIHFYAANVEQVYVADNIFGPQSDSDVDLGSTSVRWKDAFVDSITVTGEIDGDSLDIEGNADINGTTNLDAVDIDGAVQIDATVTVGVDDTGYDVKFFGATSGKYMEWDESADQLDVTGSLDVTGDASVTGTLQLKNGATSAGKVEFYEDSDNGTNKVTLIGPASTSDITLTLPSSDGDSGQFLQTNGSGVMSWAAAGGAYSDWDILTTTPTNLVAKGQYVCKDTTARTHTLPSGSAGDSIVIANVGSATVTIARTSSQKINGVDADGTLPEGNSVQLVYVDSSTGWFEI